MTIRLPPSLASSLEGRPVCQLMSPPAGCPGPLYPLYPFFLIPCLLIARPYQPNLPLPLIGVAFLPSTDDIAAAAGTTLSTLVGPPNLLDTLGSSDFLFNFFTRIVSHAISSPAPKLPWLRLSTHSHSAPIAVADPSRR